MAYELKEGQGSLFKNTKKQSETHPDYQGSIKVNGQEYWLNAWVKEGNSGKYFSLSVKPKQQKDNPTAGNVTHTNKSEMPVGFDDFDNDIPFN